MTAFDPTKPVQTRDGRPARILCTDRTGSQFPIIALISFSDAESVVSVKSNGCMYGQGETPNDLVNVPEVTKKYRRVYEGPGYDTAFSEVAYSSEQGCRNGAGRSVKYYGILEEVFTDGEFTTINFIPW